MAGRFAGKRYDTGRMNNVVYEVEVSDRRRRGEEREEVRERTPLPPLRARAGRIRGLDVRGQLGRRRCDNVPAAPARGVPSGEDGCRRLQLGAAAARLQCVCSATAGAPAAPSSPPPVIPSPHLLTRAVFLIEAWEDKTPAEAELGSTEAVEALAVEGAGDGHVPRNARIM